MTPAVPPAVTPGGPPPDAALPATLRAQFPAPLRDALLALRRDLHRRPELAFQEVRTAARLTEALEPLRAPGALRSLTRVAGTGVIARLRGRDPAAPVVAVRGDIDALPIQEATGLEYSSEVPGVMHACGHDVHAAWAVGAAHLLAAEPAAGDVVVVLQPAEETGTGAATVLASGALDDVAVIFGAHVDRRFAVGQVVADDGPLAASADAFAIELVGSGAHAARPHEAADPIVGAAALVSALQTLVSRRLNPASAGVVTVGALHAGVAGNVIPDRAELLGTVRAVDPAARALLLDELRRMVDGVAAAYRLTARVTFGPGVPPVVNPPGPTAWARRAARATLGDDAVVPLGLLNLAAEDFAHYMERMPGCFLRVGAREPGGPVVAAHSPHFYAADDSVLVGAAVLAAAARHASDELAASG